MNLKSASLPALKKIFKFLDNTSYFRLALMCVLFCDVRYMFPWLYYSFMSVAVVWSVYIFIKKMIVQGGIKRVRYRRIIYLFLIGASVSVLLHCTSNFIENLFSLYMIAVCFFMFYGIHSEKSNFRIKKEMKRLLHILIAVTTLLMIAGLVVLAVYPSGVHINGFDFGIHENRFVGVIPNANVNAFYAVMALVSCHLLWKIKKADGSINTKFKVYCIVCAVINIVSVFLTDSNDTLLFIVTYFCFYAFYGVFRDFGKPKRKRFFMRLTAAALSFVIIIAACVSLRVVTQNGVSLLITSGESNSHISMGIKADQNGSVKIEDDTDLKSDAEKNETQFKHNNKNIDSGRFVLWRQALSLFEHYPVMGIGKANIVDYGTKYLGGIKYTQLGDFKYVDFHNGLITILVSFGLVGFNIFMVFALTVAKTMLKSIFKFRKENERDGNVLVAIVSFCAAYCVYSMFEVSLLVDDSYRVFIFWIMIGFGLSYAFKYIKQNRIDSYMEKSKLQKSENVTEANHKV